MCVFYCGEVGTAGCATKKPHGASDRVHGSPDRGALAGGEVDPPQTQRLTARTSLWTQTSHALTHSMGGGLCLSGDPCDRYERKRSKKKRDEESTYRDTEDGDHTQRRGGAEAGAPSGLLTKLFPYVASGPAGYTS